MFIHTQSILCRRMYDHSLGTVHQKMTMLLIKLHSFQMVDGNLRDEEFVCHNSLLVELTNKAMNLVDGSRV